MKTVPQRTTLPIMNLQMNLLAAAFAAALTGGCAALPGDCGPDWRAIGQRDGRLGAQSQIDNYARRCGVPVDSAQYNEGWREGFAQRPTPLW